jgi:hypothetical protein
MFLLPCGLFGQWSDLLCRGSAPLMFLLLVFFLQAIHHNWLNHRKTTAIVMLLLWTTGTVSALLQLRSAYQHYGETQPIQSLILYNNAYPNLGPDNTLFNHYFRKKIQP